MKKTKILAIILCTVMLIFPVCAASAEDGMEDVVRLGRYSSKIDPEAGFREDCILVATYPVMDADGSERELTAVDFPKLDLSDVRKISSGREMFTDVYALYLAEPGRRQVAEAIVALENDLGVLSEYLCYDRVFPSLAISPWYDYLAPDGRFTNINVERDPAGGYWMHQPVIIVAFEEKPSADPEEHPEEVFPFDAVSVENEYTSFYGHGEYTWRVELASRGGSALDAWAVVYDALKTLNEREDVKAAFAETYAVGTTPVETFDKTDYSKDDWFFSHVVYVIKKGWMKYEKSGYTFTHPDGFQLQGTLYSFYPHMTLTRGMLATVLYRMAGSPAADGGVDFVDVENGAWYEDAVAWAVETGLTEGVGGRYYAPNRTVTREEFATFMYRYHTVINESPVRYSDAFDGFVDGDMISPWAEDAMSWAVGNLLFVGRDGNLLAPAENITRAECAKVLERYDDYVPKK